MEGATYFEGCVEIRIGDEWTAVAVCDDSINDNVAEVVCYQLGLFSPGKLT